MNNRDETERFKKDAFLDDVYKSGDLKKLTDEIPSECVGNAIAFFSDFDSFSRVFEKITGIRLGEPSERSKLISDEDIDVLNRMSGDVKSTMESLCLCISRKDQLKD